MKALHLLFIFSLLYNSVIAQKAVFVIVDGIAADMLETIATPHLDSIAAVGTYTRAYVGGNVNAYNQTPTISANGYNSLLTGTWVNKHNVWDNDIKAPNYNYPTIFKIFKDQYPQKTIGVFSTWLDNRTKLIGEGLPATKNLKTDFHADGFELDTINFPHDEQSQYMNRIDDTVTNIAAATIAAKAPDLSWVYLEYTDDMGHAFGDSPQLTDAIQKMDQRIGRLWQAIQYRQQHFKEDWMIIITTDHGRGEKNGKDHGGQTPRQRSTWIVSNKSFNNYVHYNKPAIVDIMPTLARFLNVNFTASVAEETDGIPLIGKLSVARSQVNVFQNKMDISWQCLDTAGTVKIKVTTTNNFKTGGKDQYTLLQEVPVSQAHAVIDISKLPSTFYKVVLEGKYNTVNRWFLAETK